jgi:DNA anti-recombination protein RmuC
VLTQLLNQVLGDEILLASLAAMICLFLYDIAALITRERAVRHLDFKSAILSIGVFGTFLGLLKGLYGFDSTDISGSVPKLLEALKFAFAASVFGMFLGIWLSILEKLLRSSDDQSDVAAQMSRTVAALEKSVEGLASSVKSPTELVNQFSELKVFLQGELRQINHSLDKALVELASGASKEIIRALENVIREFNQNLTTQFGENFRELNAACLKLVEWQRQYKSHIDSTESYLTEIRSSLGVASSAARELVAGQQDTHELCAEVGGLIKTYDVQVRTLATHLESCKRLGDEAREFLTSTGDALTISSRNMNEFSGTIATSVRAQSESLTKLTQDIEVQLPKALGELEAVLTKITKQFAGDYRSLFEFMTAKR